MQEQNEGWTKKDQQQEPEPEGESPMGEQRFTLGEVRDAFIAGVNAAHADARECRTAKRRRGLYRFRAGHTLLDVEQIVPTFARTFPHFIARARLEDVSQYEVRPCRGHWHVALVGGDDLALPGDPFKTAFEARDAMRARDDLDAMSYASAQSFLAFEASLPGNGMHCPTCGGRVNATDSLAGVSVLAVDPSRSTPAAVVPEPSA